MEKYEIWCYFYTDINECTSNTQNCHSNATCNNTDGSFTCACNSGYTGDGINCTGMSWDTNHVITQLQSLKNAEICQNKDLVFPFWIYFKTY
jgi:hypothetical protein